jgi:seryl-tRNA synthetase
MGLFGRDDAQDERLNALEAHVRKLTEAHQQSQLDAAALRIDVMRLRANVAGKVSSDELDPTIVALNQELAEARKQYEEVEAAASDSWATLQAGTTEAVRTLRDSVEAAADRIGKVAD